MTKAVSTNSKGRLMREELSPDSTGAELTAEQPLLPVLYRDPADVRHSPKL